MSGLIFVGMALGGIHIANAQNNVNSEIDNSRYTVMIPSEVNIDKNTGKGSFAVTGKVKAQSTIDVSIQSKNGYKLKDKNGELPYNIDKKSFSIDNSRSASDIPLNEEFNIASKTNTKVSGYYTDSLTFDITSESYKYRLDVNGNLDDNGISDGRLDDFGRFDVYLNGKLVKENVEDFCEPIPYGTTWEIKNIRSLDGYRYKESSDIRTKGVAGDVVEWEGDLLGDASIYRITYVNLKFYSNKLTINYHADGAQSWKTANVNNASEIDVTGKDIMETEALKYDELYSEDAEKQHFCSIARIKRDGYTAKANTWKVGQNGSLEVQDNKILQKAQDVAKYCGVLDEFKKNDTTIDLYPIWEPLFNTITYDANGGTLSTTKTQQFYTGTPYKTPENPKSFSGTSTDDCEDLGYYNYSFGNKLTISTKIRFDSSDDTLPQKSQEFFCNYEWGGFGLGLGEDARPFFSVFRENKDDYDILRSKTKIKPNETYWITGVYDGPNNTMSIYINGEKTNTIQLSATDNPNIKVSPLGLSLGGNPIVGDHYSNLTKGDIWKCGLWQNALSDEEVMKMYKTDTLAEGSFISRDYSAPKKTYYLFDGWYTQPTGGNKITTGTIINSSMTLYAHYKPILSFINYDSNESTGVMQSETILSTDKTNLSKNIFTKDGYAFKGWLASRKYKSNVEYLYVNPNGGGGWFEKGAQPSGWSKLYLLSDEEPIYLISAYDGLTLTFHAQWEKAYSAGTVLNIEGTEYTVIEQKENSKYLVMMNKSIGKKSFQSTSRSDGQNMNTYEESEIDNYLENEWYNSLSSTMKTAIQTTNIKQASYADWKNPDSKQETGYNGQVYNTISRHIFLPSLSEIGEVVDLKNSNKMKAFLHGVDIWIRDSCQYSDRKAGWLYADGGSLNFYYVFDYGYVRPSFVIDLSKVDYTVTGTVNSK